MDGLLTSRQVAQIADVSQSTVNRWVDAGRLEPALEVPGYRGARLFTPASVQSLIDERAT